MGFFGKPGAQQPAPRKEERATPRGPASVPPTNMRRELLRLALRQSLSRNGIPVHWIGVEALELPGPGTPLHVRLVVQHWDERLLRYTLAFQDDLEQRLLAVDPLARTWVRGFSWQYDLPDSVPRLSLPDPASWAEDHATTPAALPNAGDASRRARDDLDRLLAAQDQRVAEQGEPRDFQPTHPTA